MNGLATGHGLCGAAFQSRWRQKILSSPYQSSPAPRVPPGLLYDGYRCCFFVLWLKLPGRGVVHPPSSAKFNLLKPSGYFTYRQV